MLQRFDPGKTPVEPNIRIVHLYTVIALSYCAFFSVIYFVFAQSTILSFAHVLTLCGVLINYWIIKRTGNYQRGAYILLTLGIIIMYLLFATGGWQNGGICWPFAYLPASFFLIKGRGRFIFPIVLIAGCSIITLLHLVHVLTLPWSSIMLLNFFIALGVATVLLVLYQNASNKYEADREMAERELKEREEQIQVLFRYAPDAVITINSQGIIVNWNPMAEKIFGWKQSEVTGLRLHEVIIPANMRDAHMKGMSHFLSTGEGPVLNKSIEVTALRKGNIEFPAELSISPFMYKENYFFVGFIRDIAERRETEKMRLELLNELEKANKELESFTYSVSHDLRSPLRTIHGFTRILEKDYKDKIDNEGLHLMTTVMAEAKRMGKLIDDLLALSRIGKIEIQKTTTDMTELAQSVVEDISEEELANKRITIHKLNPAYCDAAFMRQVFVNLISNSLKYSGIKSNPEIEIGSYQNNGENIYFVKDNGAGFDMLYYNKLFHVFQRLHSQEEFEGTGVGLAIVDRIVARHGGRVWAEGRVDEGATFYFSLPCN